jgi:hypothetical protein
MEEQDRKFGAYLLGFIAGLVMGFLMGQYYA